MTKADRKNIFNLFNALKEYFIAAVYVLTIRPCLHCTEKFNLVFAKKLKIL